MFDVKKDEKYKEDLAHYRTVLHYMGSNVPIGVLCLPKSLEKILLRDGCVRVYDLINRDLTKIEGMGDRRRDLLASRLDEFFSVSL